MSATFEEVELMLQVARDASLGEGFQSRLDAIGDSVLALIPGVALSVMAIPHEASHAQTHLLLKNSDPDRVRVYLERYVGDDPMGVSIKECTGLPITLSDYVRDSDYGRDPFTGEFLPQDGVRYLMGVVHRMPDDGRFVLGIHREPLLGDFTRKERDILRLIAPDLCRAAYGTLLREKVSSLLAASEGETESPTCGVVVFDEHGDIQHADAGALAFFRRFEPQSIYPADALVADVRSLASGRSLEGATIERRLVLADKSVLRSRTSVLKGPPQPVIIAVLEQAAVGPREAFDDVARRNRLTPREQQVAALAIQGLGNRHIGYELGISPITVGVHLGKIYRKCSVHGRLELTRLLTGT